MRKKILPILILCIVLDLFLILMIHIKVQQITYPEAQDFVTTQFYANMLKLTAKAYYYSDINFYKNYTEQIFKDCNTDLCKTRSLYIFLRSNFDYEVGEDTNPKKLINDKSADCDEFSILVMTFLNSINIDSSARCTYTHCWVELELDNNFIKIDVAKGDYLEH